MRIKQIFIYAGVFLLYSLMVNFPVSADNSTKEFENSFEKCFREELVASDPKLARSRYVDAYIAEVLINHFESSTRLDQAEAGRLCRQIAIPKYLKAAEAGARNVEKERAKEPDLAKLSQPIELDSKFTEIVANRFIDHTVTGHTQITNYALSSLPDSFQLGTDAKQLLISSSQTPDLYRWTDDRYHAITCEYPSLKKKKCLRDQGTEMAREEKISKSQALFIRLIHDVRNQIVKRSAQREYARALFWMGVGCHAVEDLAFHRGMTASQHSGLAYVKGKDPDNPSGVKGQANVRTAVDLCTRFLFSALSQVGPNLAYLKIWKPASGFSLRNLAMEEFGSATDFNTSELIKYWRLSRQYRNDPDKQKELEEVPNGLIVWDLDYISSRLFGR